MTMITLSYEAGAVRSSANRLQGIGREAEQITAGHNSRSWSFKPEFPEPVVELFEMEFECA